MLCYNIFYHKSTFFHKQKNSYRNSIYSCFPVINNIHNGDRWRYSSKRNLFIAFLLLPGTSWTGRDLLRYFRFLKARRSRYWLRTCDGYVLFEYCSQYLRQRRVFEIYHAIWIRRRRWSYYLHESGHRKSTTRYGTGSCRNSPCILEILAERYIAESGADDIILHRFPAYGLACLIPYWKISTTFDSIRTASCVQLS